MPQGDLRLSAHRIADFIYEKLTGDRGIFSTRIAYITSTGLGKVRQYKLIVADSDGFNPTAMVTSREPLLSPAWSPDSRRLAYVSFERGNSACKVTVELLACGNAARLQGVGRVFGWSASEQIVLIVIQFLKTLDLLSQSHKMITDRFIS